jgi:hypothetical protein
MTTGNVCNNSNKQESSGFLSLDSAHENHSDERDDSDRDTRAPGSRRHLDVRQLPLRAQYAGSELDERRAVRRRSLLTLDRPLVARRSTHIDR